MSGFLLDTNVLSELARPDPNIGVVEFISDLENAYISVLTIHELYFGIERLPQQSKRKEKLGLIVEELVGTFRDNILPLDQAESRVAAKMRADAERVGRVTHLVDSLIAATAFTNGLSVVTRNEKDFVELQVSVVNPWKED
ncbi:MAG: type II toxin-antitoxin system VapC family toxin [Opitutaceae bacterium]